MRIGVDLISSDRFLPLTETAYTHWRHVFSEAEWAYACKDKLAHLHLAGMFSAKEAAMKATGKVGASHYRTFEISHDPEGAPYIVDTALTISISHADGMVIAVALAYGV